MSLSWEFRKKWLRLIIGALVLLLAIGSWVYIAFFKKPETCFDNKQNQNETGVDCGGLCDKMCLSDVTPLIKVWTRPFIISPGIASVVAYIENSNETSGIEKIPYEIRVYDEKNILIADPVVGETFVGPKSKFAIFESVIPVGNIAPVTAFIKFGNVQKWVRTEPVWSAPLTMVSNIVVSDETSFPKVQADVSNTVLFDLVQIPVTALVYGTDNNLITASQTFIESLPSGQTETVYFTWQLPFSGPVGRVEIIPRVNPFVQSPN